MVKHGTVAARDPPAKTEDDMNSLDKLIPTPRLLEEDHIDVTASAEEAWQLVRHADLARTPLIRALFWLRSIPDRVAGHAPEASAIHLDDLISSPERPGFKVMWIDPPHEIAVAAIGKVWEPEIPFVYLPDAARYAAYAEPDFIKVAWAIRIESLGHAARLSLELRVDATDDASWTKFQHYFRLIGPGSRFIRRSALASLAKELGTQEHSENQRPLPGDELLGDAAAQVTHGITIEAAADKIWPWLVQMGSGRAGFYSIDWLDNGARRSAREVHQDWQQLEVGQLLPITPDGNDAFEVLRVAAPHVLVLGGLYDLRTDRRLGFATPRPQHFWHVTWAFVLEPVTPSVTRLHVRARATFSPSGALHAAWTRPVHSMMEHAQLRHLRARVEGTLARDDERDVLEGIGGVARICLALASPFSRASRSHWGLDSEAALRALPGDELVVEPRWGWTHAVEIEASAAQVWPWIAQIGAKRAGFYSYQWLENMVGCEVRNAETVHPDWAVKLGDDFFIHPDAPPLKVAHVEAGRYFVAYAAPDARARAAGERWVAASWLFLVEPLGDQRCRFVSRYRVAHSHDLATRLSFGPTLLEPIGFAMDRRMLLGVKARSEAALREVGPA
jgi:hypothetical protein